VGKRDLAALTPAFLGSTLASFLTVKGWDLGAWLARGITFGIMFGFVLIFWRRNKHRTGSWQDARDLLPRFKGTKK
jgi:hypothetical protein